MTTDTPAGKVLTVIFAKGDWSRQQMRVHHAEGRERVRVRCFNAFSHDHRWLTLVASVLHQHGVTPDLYDLFELDSRGLRLAAYAAQHVVGRPANDAECAAGLAPFEELEARRAFKVRPACARVIVCAELGAGHAALLRGMAA